MEGLYGRKRIETNAERVDETNVRDVLESAFLTHDMNRARIQYLYDYYRGRQDILGRTKTNRTEINNKVTENRAYEIVSFKVGYLVGEPVQYVSTKKDTSEKAIRLNGYMAYNARQTKDVELVEWQSICGTAYYFALANPDEDEREMSPFEIEVSDPRQTFVIYSTDVSHRPVAGVYFTVGDDGERENVDVYTPELILHLRKDTDEIATEPNVLGMIPIIEYPANSSRIGEFEKVVSLLNAINTLDSNRLDGVEQFIQSLLVLVNADLDDNENAETIRDKGMILLKNVGENKADVKIIAESLDQAQTQTLKDDFYNAVLTICSMPSRNSNDSGSNGIAIVYRDGWSAAETAAKASEAMYKKSDVALRRVLNRIIEAFSPEGGIAVTDVACKFTRRSYENIETKSQTLNTMLNNDKIDPLYAYTACGLFVDPEEAYAAGMAWYKSQGGAQQAENGGGEYISGYYRESAQ